MKTSYLLLGMPWDGMPVPEKGVAHLPFDQTIAEAGRDDCLFDLASRKRFIRISSLLSCNSMAEVEAIIVSLRQCDGVYILLDFLPESVNSTIVAFYRLRCLQVIRFVSDSLPRADVAFMESPEALRLKRAKRLTIPWLINMAERYVLDAGKAGVGFDTSGFPLIPREWYASQIPSDMIDYSHRNSRFIANPSSTAICFFMGDSGIYPRFEKLEKDLIEFRRYAAVVMPDVTVTADMDLAWQAFIMLLNQLYAAVIATHGVKIIANTRCGSFESRRFLSAIPRGVLCASGTLGCARLVEPYDYSYAEKILAIHPMALLTYGKKDPIAKEQLSTMGVNVVSFADSHTRSKGRNLHETLGECDSAA